jgi:hypothetical protein
MTVVVEGSPLPDSPDVATEGDALPAKPVPATRPRVAPLPWACLPLAVLGLTFTYSWADTHGDEQGHFHLFWLSFLLFLVPASARLLQRNLGTVERIALLVASGLLAYVPKLLRDPYGPLYADEMIHWRQSARIVETGQLFLDSPLLRVVRYYPGLHSLTAGLQELTGLTTWTTAIVVLVMARVLGVIGVYVAGAQVTRSRRAGGAVALLYTLNPSFMFFDMQFAYESLALVLFVWTIAALAIAVRREERGRSGVPWWAVALVCIALAAATHHLTSYVTALVVALVAGFSWRRRDQHRRIAVLTAAAAAWAVAWALGWLLVVAPFTLSYLEPYPTKAVDQLASIVSGQQQSRTLFEKSQLPAYERISGLLVPVILTAVVGLILLGRWRQRRRYGDGPALGADPLGGAMAAFGLLYFPSLLFMLSRSGNEGARRSWAFTFLGLAVIIAAPLLRFVDLATLGGRVQRAARIGMVAVLLVTVQVGDVASAVNETYRYPGPYQFGSDTRSATAELYGLTAWFSRTYGPGRRLVGDRSTKIIFGAYGDAEIASPDDTFRTWTLYFDRDLPDPGLMNQLRDGHWDHLVIDKRISRNLPRIGVYFLPDEPEAFQRTTPPPDEAIAKYDELPFAIKVFESENYDVYRFDYAAYARSTGTGARR